MSTQPSRLGSTFLAPTSAVDRGDQRNGGKLILGKFYSTRFWRAPGLYIVLISGIHGNIKVAIPRLRFSILETTERRNFRSLCS
jgi:hypothetical protein